MAILGSFLGGWEIALLVAWPTGWGVGFALWERFRLAPRGRVAAVVPAFFSGIIPAAFAAIAAAASLFQGGSRAPTEAAESAILAFVLFFACLIPAFATFLISRRLLRTRFSDDIADRSPPS